MVRLCGAAAVVAVVLSQRVGLQVQVLQLGMMVVVVVVKTGRGRRLEQARIEAQHVEVGSRRRFGQQKCMVGRCN